DPPGVGMQGRSGAAETSAPSARRTAAAPSSLSVRYLPAVGLVALLAIAVALPFTISNFRLFQFSQVLIYAVALLWLNMLTGYNGQISLGHGAFYAIGAYSSAIMIDRWAIHYFWTIPAAGLICLVVGFLFGRPALRLEGLYLALATFALALSVPQI